MNERNLLNHIDFRVTLLMLYKGQVVIDDVLAEVLRLLSEKGSLLAACRGLGLSYSRIWEKIAKVERILGHKLIIAKRGGKGGGGATLTPLARRLLKLYYNAMEKIKPCSDFLGHIVEIKKPPPDITIIGSHDLLLEHMIGGIREAGFSDIEVHWTGSLGGLAAIILGEADIAGIHLYDIHTKTYNLPFIERFMLKDRVVLVEGYKRELVFAYRDHLHVESVDDILKMLKEGKLTLANRNVGSGTRLFLETLLKQYGISTDHIKGFETEYHTHFETVSAVASGKADICLTLRYLAEMYGLESVHVTWEDYDFIIPRDRLNKESIKLFIEVLKRYYSKINKYKGYIAKQNMGKIKAMT